MLSNQTKYTYRIVGLYLLLAPYVLVPTAKVAAAGIAFAGINEASLTTLSPGMSATNLSLTANPASPAGTTNISFVIERQGAIFRQFTSAPPFTITLSN